MSRLPAIVYIVENFQTKTNTRMVLKVLVIVCVWVCACVCDAIGIEVLYSAKEDDGKDSRVAC